VEPFGRALESLQVDCMINGRRRDHGADRAFLEVGSSSSEALLLRLASLQGPVQALGSTDPVGCQQVCSAPTIHRDVLHSDDTHAGYCQLLHAPGLHLWARAGQPVPVAMPGRLHSCMVHRPLGIALYAWRPELDCAACRCSRRGSPRSASHSRTGRLPTASRTWRRTMSPRTRCMLRLDSRD
jgi:hypothetical protein